jgi:hypothetical protein
VEPSLRISRAAGRPPLLLAAWLVVALVFGALLAIERATESGLDDPDPAWQRPGVLDVGALPQPAPRLTAVLPRPGRRAVAFFVRPDGVARLCRSLARHSLAGDADVVIAVSGSGRCEGVPTLEDPSAGRARAYGLRRPRDGGAPVGYAVVDRHGRIRYRTLDPGVAEGLREVDTMVAATP